MSEAAAGSQIETPPEVLALEARARREETPCGDGMMVWRIWGTGEPLVVGHGAQGDWTHWVRNIDLLASKRMVLIPDLPGHGDSAMPNTPDHDGVSLALATGLRMLLGERLPVDLLGFSFGGVCLGNLAARYPDIARRLIIVGCGGLGTPVGDIRVGSIRGLEGEARLAQLKANLVGLMLHSEASIDDFSIWQLVTRSRKARLSAPELVMEDKLLKALPHIKVPVDAIWGECDRPHPYPEEQKAALLPHEPDIDFRIIEGAGHWAMFERSEAFNRTVTEMLATRR